MCCDMDVYRWNRLLVLRPKVPLRALPSGHYNPDIVDPVTAIVNMTSMGLRAESSIMGQSLSVNDLFTSLTLEAAGLDPQSTVAFGTAAHMDNACISNVVSDGGIKVSAVVTGGIRGNGGRAGDFATYDEAETPYCHRSGTIVIILAIEAELTDGALFDAMLAATEAKSCVIQELQARSLYSPRIATGSGTDQVGVACLRSSDVRVDSAGSCSDVGEAVVRCVRDALYRTFDMQSGMDHRTQFDPYVIMSRFGIDFKRIRDETRFPCTMAQILDAESRLHGDALAATVVHAVARVMDDVALGTVPEEAGLDVVRSLVEGPLLTDSMIGPFERVILDSSDSILDYICFALSTYLRHLACHRGVSA